MGDAGIKFVHGKPALVAGGVLAVADLHLGIERELDAKGLRVGGVAEAMKRGLVELVCAEKPEKLVIVGDAKHHIRGAPKIESLGVKELLAELAALAEVIIVPGNHDAGLEVPGARVSVARGSGIRIGGVAFAHGHAKPSPEAMGADCLVVGHMHPCVEVVDERGQKSVERAWALMRAGKRALLGEYPEANPGIRLVVMPAFNPLVGGVLLNRGKEGALKGPLFRSGIFKLAAGEIFLLDGSGLSGLESPSGLQAGE
ncbi:MAG: metallophosphoesterase [Candidatus ainarchaeum sp.]|nr:metallophosphoesterase [Candidatus ainarchaeum sp.]